MAQKGTTICHTEFPLYTIKMIGDRHFMVAGGGGKAKTGIRNAIDIFEMKNDNGNCVANRSSHFETEDRATMNCDVCKTDNVFVIAAGQDEGCQIYTLRSKVIALKPQETETSSSNNAVRKRKSIFTKSESYDNAKKSVVFSLEKEQFTQTDYDKKGAFQKVVNFSTDTNTLATGGSDGHIRLWKRQSLSKEREIKAHSDEIDDLCFSPAGNLVCSVGKDNKCMIWKSADGTKKAEAVWNFNTKAKYRFRSCRYGKVIDKKDEYRLFTTHIPVVRSKHALCYISKWDTQTYKPSKVQSTGDEILSALALSDDGTYLGVGTISGSVSVYVSFNLQKLYHLRAAHTIFVTGLEFAPTSSSAMAVTGGYDFTLLSISADNQVKLHQTQPPNLVSVIWPILGAIFLIYLLFWLISALGL